MNKGTWWSGEIAKNLAWHQYINAFVAIDKGIFVGLGDCIKGGCYTGTVYFSADNGNSFTEANTGLVNAPVKALAVCGDYIYASIKDNGVWRRPLSEITSVLPVKSMNNPIQENKFVRVSRDLNSGITLKYTI